MRARASWFACLLMALASLVYAVCTLKAAIENPYWMDEVLAVWTARQATAGAVWGALNQGAEFSPPLFHWLLHGLVRLGLDGRLAMRAPSILAIYGVACCAFTLVRRRSELGVAALAFSFVLCSGLIDYAVQARPYAMVVLCFAVAVVLWNGLEGRTGGLRAVAIGAVLALAVGLHFYAIVLVGTLFLVELAWSLKHRRLRWPILAAIAAGGGSILLWWPIVQHVSSFNRGDTAAPLYYAHPTPMKLLDAYVGVLAGYSSILASPLVLLMVTGVAAFVYSLRTRWRIGDLDLIGAGACLIPVLVYGFAVLVSHTFNERYCIAAALGFALVMARSAAALPRAAWTAPALGMVLLLASLSPLRTALLADDLRADAALAERAPPGLPIATGNGLRFLELRENTDPKTAARLIYLTAPNESALGDPTNEHQVERWKRINPGLAVAPATPFFAGNRSFLWFSDPDAAAEAPSLFDPYRAKTEVLATASSATLLRVSLRDGRP